MYFHGNIFVATDGINNIVAAHTIDPELHRVLNEEVPKHDEIKQLTDRKITAAVRGYLDKNLDRNGRSRRSN